MVIGITAQLKGHDVLLSFRLERRVAFRWVLQNVNDIIALEVDCGLNTWSWCPEIGWIQYPQCVYTPGRGVHRANVKPIKRGNSYDAIHPWRFCMEEPLTPNPLCIIDTDCMF